MDYDKRWLSKEGAKSYALYAGGRREAGEIQRIHD